MNSEIKKRTELYQRMEAEYNNFIEEVKKKSPDEMLDYAYEKVMKEETLSMFFPESENFDIEHIKALSKTEAPLDELYQGWMDSDLNLNELYEDNVRDTLYDLCEEQKKSKHKANKNLER